VGDLSVPDPRITNPELFDLKNKEAPIPQFANALENAGINLTPEEIAQGITYVSTKEDGTPLVDKDGNPFVVAVYNLDPSLFPKEYQDLAGPIPLMIAKRGENGWEWSIKVIPTLSNALNKKIGVFVDPRYNKPNTNGDVLIKNFNLISPGAFSWDWVRRKGQDISAADFSLTDNWVNFATQNNMDVINGNPLVYHRGLPDWLTRGNFSKDELIKIMTDHIKTTVKRYAGKGIKWVVLNEAVWYSKGTTGFENSIWYKTIGEEYITCISHLTNSKSEGWTN